MTWRERTRKPPAFRMPENAASFGVLLSLHPEHLCAPASADNRKMLLTFQLPTHAKVRARLGTPRVPRAIFRGPEPLRAVLPRPRVPCPAPYLLHTPAPPLAAAVASWSCHAPSRPTRDHLPSSPAQCSGTAPQCSHVALSPPVAQGNFRSGTPAPTSSRLDL